MTGPRPVGGAASWVLAGLAAILGGGSLLLFGLFLVAGPFAWVDLGFAFPAALAVDAALCGLFFVQHSVMVRRGFRRAIEQCVGPDAHGAFYAVASGAALLLLVAGWQGPRGAGLQAGTLTTLLLRAALLAGLAGFAWSARALGSFDSLGLAALRRARHGRERVEPRFVVRGPYRWVRHPFYTCALLILWSSPAPSADRLLLNLLFSAWIVAGARLEERDLLASFGGRYAAYRRRVPMLIPWRAPLPRGATS